MADVCELKLEKTSQTRHYYIFELLTQEKTPPLFPKKVYLNKDLFKKEPSIIRFEVKM